MSMRRRCCLAFPVLLRAMGLPFRVRTFHFMAGRSAKQAPSCEKVLEAAPSAIRLKGAGCSRERKTSDGLGLVPSVISCERSQSRLTHEMLLALRGQVCLDAVHD